MQFVTPILLAITLLSAADAQQRSFTPAGPAAPHGGLGCAPEALVLPTYQEQLDLNTWQGCGGSAWPFAQAFTPDGSRLYVALFGGLIGSGGCTVVRLDPATRQVVGTVMTGESPEELAFVTWPGGGLRYGFVSDSSASTVTVFDGNDQVIATVPIPFDPAGSYPTAFPQGLAVSPDQTRVYVATGNGEGWVHAIDVASMTLDVAAAIDIGAGHSASRLAFAGERLLIPSTLPHPNWTGSTAKLFVADTSQAGSLQELVLGSANDGAHFPSPADVVVDCQGRAWVAGFDLGARVLAVDPAGPTLVGSIPTHTANADGKFQALGLSSDGMLVAGDLWTNELAVIDVRRGLWMGILDGDALPAPHRAPQEVAFDPIRAELVVTWAATDDMSWFGK